MGNKELNAKFVGILCLLFFSVRLWAADEVVGHDLDVYIDPIGGELVATDRITLPATLLPEGGGEIGFRLHDALQLSLLDDMGSEQVLQPHYKRQGYSHYQVSVPAGTDQVVLNYKGNLGAANTGDGGQAISAEGVQLSGNTRWYPEFGDQQLRFELAVDLPAGWLAVSQGARLSQQQDGGRSLTAWKEVRPQRQIWLLANRFSRYEKSFPEAEAMAFLLRPDNELAERYLDATGEYLKLYSELIGPYPYAKFALVENRQQTGYGMPSFTLIGSRVLRLPFLLQSSYPHEILHNWWGNSVYIDYDEGNWSEGLTAYLADHLIAERQGRGAEYRRAALQKYADYVSAERDFPLREFRSRHGDASMAVGYNKSLLFFHDLRRRLGDEPFFQALRGFYKALQFKTASWEELEAHFEKVSGQDLHSLFAQWLEREGAPLLSVSGVTVRQENGSYRLSGTLKQEQGKGSFDLLVPLRITLGPKEDVGDGTVQRLVSMDRMRQEFELLLPAKPMRLEVDPHYDLFRRLHSGELPPSLGQVFGSEKITAVLPADAMPELREELRKMAKGWGHTYPQMDIVLDSEIESLPEEGALWVLGWQNRFLPQLQKATAGSNISFDGSGITLAEQRFGRDKFSAVATARREVGGLDQPLAWLGCDNLKALPGLARKVPHYGRYGYLAFSGDAPDNVLKGELRGGDSPLDIQLTEAE